MAAAAMKQRRFDALAAVMLVVLCACGVGRTFVDSRRYAPWLHQLLLAASVLAGSSGRSSP